MLTTEEEDAIREANQKHKRIVPISKSKQEQFTVEHVEQALRNSMGIYTGAAAQLKCSSGTISNYVERYPYLKRVCTQILEQRLDIAETKLLKQIKADNLTAIIFYLKTKGKQRGYSERHEVTGANGAPIVLSAVELANMTDEQLEGLISGQRQLPGPAAASDGGEGEAEAET